MINLTEQLIFQNRSITFVSGLLHRIRVGGIYRDGLTHKGKELLQVLQLDCLKTDLRPESSCQS